LRSLASPIACLFFFCVVFRCILWCSPFISGPRVWCLFFSFVPQIGAATFCPPVFCRFLYENCLAPCLSFSQFLLVGRLFLRFVPVGIFFKVLNFSLMRLVECGRAVHLVLILAFFLLFFFPFGPPWRTICFFRPARWELSAVCSPLEPVRRLFPLSVLCS